MPCPQCDRTVTVTLTRSELVRVPFKARVRTPFLTYGCRLYDCLHDKMHRAQ